MRDRAGGWLRKREREPCATPIAPRCRRRREPRGPARSHGLDAALARATARVCRRDGAEDEPVPHRTGSYTGGGRLRRPRPLPRAVREPVPARLPGEVPRLGARARLVARQPARADGRLPRRLRPALAGRTTIPHYPLYLLAGLACWIFFATSLQAARAVVRRQRRAGEEGALPAPARAVLGRRDAARHVRGDARDPDRALARLRAAGAAVRSWLSIPLALLFVGSSPASR